jgi:hypothetical protein
MRAMTLIVLVGFTAALSSGCAHQADSTTLLEQEKKQNSSKGDLERAWECKPYRHYGRYFGEFGPFGDIAFSNVDCNPPRMSLDEQETLLKKLRCTYGFKTQLLKCGSITGTSPFYFNLEKDRRDLLAEQEQRDRDQKAAEIALAEEKKRLESPEYQQMLRERQAEEQKSLAREAKEQKRLAAIAKAKEEREQIALEERKRKVRSGEVKAANFAEAKLVYAPSEELYEVVASPLLAPNQGYYSGDVLIDAIEKSDLLRGKIVNLRGFDNVYVFLRTSNRTTNYVSSNEMRIGALIKVLGRYVDNVKYNTLIGQQKTAPLIEVMYISPFVPM